MKLVIINCVILDTVRGEEGGGGEDCDNYLSKPLAGPGWGLMGESLAFRVWKSSRFRRLKTPSETFSYAFCRRCCCLLRLTIHWRCFHAQERHETLHLKSNVVASVGQWNFSIWLTISAWFVSIRCYAVAVACCLHCVCQILCSKQNFCFCRSNCQRCSVWPSSDRWRRCRNRVKQIAEVSAHRLRLLDDMMGSNRVNCRRWLI